MLFAPPKFYSHFIARVACHAHGSLDYHVFLLKQCHFILFLNLINVDIARL
jgi:hypothetical protein